MKIGFFVQEMNFRGITNSIFEYAYYNQTILKNKSYIFFYKFSKSNKNEVINKFKKNFAIYGINKFEAVKELNNKIKLDFIYHQVGKADDLDFSHNSQNMVHLVFPQNPNKINKNIYFFISKWLSKECSNSKIPHLPYIVNFDKDQKNLRKELGIKNTDTVFGYHGGESSFDLPFVHQTIIDITKKRADIFFIFLNVSKFTENSNIIFLKGTSEKKFKNKFINTCDAMIHGRALGESFGLSCAEFAIKNKPIFTYNFSRDRAHIDILKKKIFTYSSMSSLYNLLINFNKNKFKKFNSYNIYKKFNPKKVMNSFKKIFIKKQKYFNLNSYDYLMILIFKIKSKYYYVRHKIYFFYFRFLIKKSNTSL
jgi:hypothetical protein